MKYWNPQRQLDARVKLSYYRRLLGQQEVADLLNTTVLSVRNWEKGKFTLRSEIIEAVESWSEPEACINDCGHISFKILDGR